MTILILRFDAPLMSFGGPSIDQRSVVQTFPGLSLLTGLIANALGWDHRDTDRLQALQDRLRYACRLDRAGEALVDYQTVDLSRPWMRPEEAGWTTRGAIQRRGGASGEATHERLRHYRADSLCTVALTLVGSEAPSCDDIAVAFRDPARPLFIGRKCCLPAAPLLVAREEGVSPIRVLAAFPRAARADHGPMAASWWDDRDEDYGDAMSTLVPVTDERDWRDRVHVGRRLMREGRLDPPEARHG